MSHASAGNGSTPSPYPDVDPLEWRSVQPHVDALLAADLSQPALRPWLQRWSDLAAVLEEAEVQVKRRISENTADPEAEARFQVFMRQIKPQRRVAEQALKEKLLAFESGEPPADIAMMLRRFRARAQIFRPENVALLSQLDVMGKEYDKIIGGMTVEWRGQRETIPQAMKHLHEPDRTVREEAWRLVMARFAAERQRLNDLYLELLSLRRLTAHNAGLATYRDYRWQEMGRFDYTPQDCFRFHDAIERQVTPLATQLYAELAQKLSCDTLRPWDIRADPYGEPLRPFQDAAELEEGVQRIFGQVDPALAGYFALMRDGYLDLVSRPNKAPGAYCADLPLSRRPYIFMSAVGLHRDISTLLHEGGHAFHFMESLHHPLIWNYNAPMEFCEVASMSMELLGAPHLARSRGGFYSEADARRAYAEELRSIVLFLPYMAVVDAFQHWAYVDAPPTVTAADLDAKWSELWDRFLPGIDFGGLPAEKESGWQHKGHIFSTPLYYIEYGLAQLGALQIWRNALRDPAQAVADYRAALALGNTRPLPQLFAAAGARFAFDDQTVAELMALMREQLAVLEE